MKYTLYLGNVTNGSVTLNTPSTGYISLCAFAKHSAFAGIDLNRQRTAESLIRMAENILFFLPSFAKGKFSVIPSLAHDPTEKGQFSNRVGRAFADYFAKKIYGARWTLCYECVMKYCNVSLQNTGKRPDFYCISPTQQFVIESKGWDYSSVSNKKIISVKTQASLCMQTNQLPIPINFSVASIAYNIYNTPVIKFIDPEGNSTEYNKELNDELRKGYYDFIRKLIKGVSFTKFKQQPQYKEATICTLYDRPLKILINEEIFSEEKKDYRWLEKVETIEEENYYIDRDGVGIYFDLPEIFRPEPIAERMTSPSIIP